MKIWSWSYMHNFSTLLKTRHRAVAIANTHANINTYIIYIYIYSYGLNVYALPNIKIKVLNWSYDSIWTWKITQFRWGHEGKVTMAEFVPMWQLEERPGPFFFLLHEGTAMCRSGGAHKPESKSDGTFTLVFPVFRMAHRNNCCLCHQSIAFSPNSLSKV